VTTSERITRVMKKKKVKPAHLAKALDVSRSTVHGWMHGDGWQQIEQLRSIAAELGVDLAELIG
jgi:transcriptional regulator with XRE-family HTH domain